MTTCTLDEDSTVLRAAEAIIAAAWLRLNVVEPGCIIDDGRVRDAIHRRCRVHAKERSPPRR